MVTLWTLLFSQQGAVGWLGIDPSYTCTGLVLLDSQCKVITSSKIRVPMGHSRMLRAGKGLHTFIHQLTSTAQSTWTLKAIIEDAAYGAPSRITVAKLKELTGVYKFILEAHGIDWLECSPSAAKRFVAGKGNAEKWMVAREIESNYNIRFDEDTGFDLSDAAALAIWGMKR